MRSPVTRRPHMPCKAALRSDFLWQRIDDAPHHLPFLKLMPADCQNGREDW